tara:strand:- start:460 stop:1497 length:1038 start_codon:yes stop_codon:yes gene_type:complete
MAHVIDTSVTHRKIGWVVDVKYSDGKRKQLTSKKWTKKEAIARELAIQMLDSSMPGAGAEGLYTLQQGFNDAVRYVWSDCEGEKTLKGRGKDVLNYFGPNTDITSINAAKLIQYRKYLKERKNNSNSTINYKTSALRVMREMAIVHGGVESVPVFPTNLKIDKKQIETWTEEERIRVEEYLRLINRKDVVRHFEFLCEMGCRPIEMERTTKSSYNLEVDPPNVTFFKASNDNKNGNRTLPLTPKAYKMLVEQILNMRQGQENVWPLTCDALRHQIEKACRELKIEKSSVIKITRHTCGSRLGNEGATALEIANWLGHSSTQMCEKYVKMDSEKHATAYRILSKRV